MAGLHTFPPTDDPEVENGYLRDVGAVFCEDDVRIYYFIGKLTRLRCFLYHVRKFGGKILEKIIEEIYCS